MDYIEQTNQELMSSNDAYGESHPGNNHIYYAIRAVATALMAIATELRYANEHKR